MAERRRSTEPRSSARGSGSRRSYHSRSRSRGGKLPAPIEARAEFLENKDMRKVARMGAEMLTSMQQLVRRAESAECSRDKEAQRRRELQNMLQEAEDAGRKMEKRFRESENVNDRLRRDGRAALEQERSKYDSLRTEKEREHQSMVLAQTELLRLRQEAELGARLRSASSPLWCKAEICADDEEEEHLLAPAVTPVPAARQAASEARDSGDETLDSGDEAKRGAR